MRKAFPLLHPYSSVIQFFPAEIAWRILFKKVSAVILAMACLMFSFTASAGNYQAVVLGDNPTGYWRLHETPVYATATNSGSTGAALNGLYTFGVGNSLPGAIVGDNDASAQFNGLARVDVPFSATLNPNDSFTVEFWAMLTNGAPSGVYRSPVSSRDTITTAGKDRGFIFYADTANHWSFWLGNSNSWAQASGTAVVQTGVWTHVVGVYNATIQSNILYTNGVFCASAKAATFFTNASQQFQIGAGANDSAAGSFYWPGRVDEVAFYPSALNATQISAHYANGTNSSRGTDYNQVVLGDGAVGYWRLDEPAPTPAVLAANLGTLGAAANGIYVASPSTLLPAQPGMTGDGDFAVTFTNASSTPYGGKISVPYNAGIGGLTNFSLECWANVPSVYTADQALISGRWNPSGPTASGAIIYVVTNSATTPSRFEFWLGVQSGYIKIPSVNPINLGAWNHVVATFDGTAASLYINGELAGYTNGFPWVYTPPPVGAPFQLGAGANETAIGSFFLNGTLDEVAVYSNVLSPAAISNHYAAAFASPPATVTSPYFFVNPQGATVPSGSPVTLTSQAFGGVPITYQWQLNGVNLPGATGATLYIPQVTADNSGLYTAIATNGAGYNYSSAADVEALPPGAPLIIVDLPPTVTAYPGSSPDLQVQVTGSQPLTCVWTSNNIPVATNSAPILNLTQVQPSFAADYRVIIANSLGSVTSQVAVLQVPATANNYSGTVVTNTSLVSYYRLGESAVTTVAHDSWGNNDGTYMNCSQGLIPGALALSDDGACGFTGVGYGSRVVISNSAPFGYTSSSQFTISAWANSSALSGVQRVVSSRYVTSTSTTGIGFGFNGNSTIRFTTFGVVDVNGPVATALGAGQVLQPNQWYHVAATYSNLTLVIYLNGVPIITNTAATIYPNGGQPMNIGGSPELIPGVDIGLEDFVGQIDEVAFFNKALSPQAIQALYNANQGIPVQITRQPDSLQLLAGATAQFSLGLTGSQPIHYQWWSNNVAITDATNSSLVLSNVQTGWSGNQYYVVATNSTSTVTSDPGVLTVVAPSSYASQVIQDGPASYWRMDDNGGPLIHDEWAGRNGNGMGNITFGAPGVLNGDPDTALAFDGSTGTMIDVPYYAALNTPKFTIECWVQVTGGQGSGYRSPLTSRNSGGTGYMFYAGQAENWQFWCGLNNGASSPWSQLQGPPLVYGAWTHLAGTYDGSNLIFYVNGQLVASNQVAVAPNSVQPFRIAAGGSELVAGEYFFPGSIDEVAYYPTAVSSQRIQAHYAAGLYGTSTAPTFTTEPQSGTMYYTNSSSSNLGYPYTFAPVIGGSQPLSYQWFYNGHLIDGATNATYTIASLQLSDAGNYSLQVSNSAGVTNSTMAALQFAPFTPGLAFGNVSDWQVNGHASFLSPGVLQLTDGSTSEAGSAFYVVPRSIKSFIASFTYQDVGTTAAMNTADGASFCLQTMASTALGSVGGGLGVTGISPSVEFEIHIYQTSGRGIGFGTNGSTGIYSSVLPVDFSSGDPINVTVVYNQGQAAVSMVDTVTGYAFSTNIVTGDITSTLGSNSAYLGFTGGVGSIVSTQRISNFLFESSGAIPLSISANVGGTLTLAWSGLADPSLVLQQSATVTGPWQTVTNTVVTTNGQYQVSVTPAGQMQFFRLAMP